ncbi:hypothetical protein ACFLW1_03640 [Chloroflexota bacterium]
MTARRDESSTGLKLPTPNPEALKLVPETMARRYSVIPLALEGEVLHVAAANTSDIMAVEALTSYCRKRIKVVPASAEEINEAIDFNYQDYDEIEKQISAMAGTAPPWKA